MLELRDLTVADESSFRDAIAAFQAHNPGWDFAFKLDKASSFVDYVAMVNGWSRGIDVAPFVPNTYLIGVDQGKVIGRVSLRHELNDVLLQDGGHLGYGVVPSERRKGYAKALVALTLPKAKALGLKKILLTCDDDNEGSWRAIEASGGILENKRFEPGMTVAKRRYWITIP